MLRNVFTYVARFFGDLGTLLIGGVSLIPLAYSYIGELGDVHWLTIPAVKWGTLAVGFVLASYRIWRRAELARTTDCLELLIWDANRMSSMLGRVTQYCMELHTWPPQNEGRPIVRPMAREFSALPDPFVAFQLLRRRISDHNEIVSELERVHRLTPLVKLDPEELAIPTMLEDFRQYISRLEAAAAPPRSFFRDWTTQRYRR